MPKSKSKPEPKSTLSEGVVISTLRQDTRVRNGLEPGCSRHLVGAMKRPDTPERAEERAIRDLLVRLREFVIVEHYEVWDESGDGTRVPVVQARIHLANLRADQDAELAVKGDDDGEINPRMLAIDRLSVTALPEPVAGVEYRTCSDCGERVFGGAQCACGRGVVHTDGLGALGVGTAFRTPEQRRTLQIDNAVRLHLRSMARCPRD